MLIAQITDSHIVEKEKHWLKEPLTQTKERLAKVVAHLNALHDKPDVVLFTGDLSDTSTPEAYAHLKELLQPLKSRVLVIPGNHDKREEMRKAFANHPYMPSKGFMHYVIDEYPIRLIGLDTVMPGKDAGEICQERMEWLKHVLEANKEKPSLIFMHHPPAKIGNDLFDAIRCFVPDEFEKMIANQKNLLGIVTGHCHNFHVTSYGNKPCFIAPSIAPGFYFTRLGDKEISDLELEDPAITLHQWHGGSTLVSDVIRLKAHNPRVTWQIIKEKNHL